MPPPDKTVLLAASSAFAKLDPTLLAEIAAASSLSRPGGANDEFLFRVGDAAEGLFLIVAEAGAPPGPAVQVSFDDRQAVASKVGYRLFEGEIAGDLEFLMSGLAPTLPARIASARALKPIDVLHIPAAGIDRVLRASEAFRSRLVRDASQRLAGLLAEKASETVVHPEVRLAEGMLSLLDDFGHVVANKGVFASRLTQQEIANRLGISRRLLSLRCSDWSARGLVETVPFSLPDMRRLERIASFGRTTVQEALPAVIGEVEAMIARGMLTQASQVAADALALFPGNPVLAYLLALAGARMGAHERAEQILASPDFIWDDSIAGVRSRLREAWARSLDTRHSDNLDEEGDSLRRFFDSRLNVLSIDIGALHARLAKDRMEPAGPGTSRRHAALRSGLLYRQVHEARPNHYCAVNAASLHLIGGRQEDAKKLAAEAIRLAEREQADYWASASRGEALLVLGRADEARQAFVEAVAQPDADLARMISTRRQLRLLEESAGLDVTPGLEVLDPGDPVFFSGLLMTPKDGTPEALAQAEKALRAAIDQWLAARRVPLVFSSLACGSDILFAEAAIRADIPLHVILPFSIDRFADLSVRIGDGEGYGSGWENRYLRCLDEATSVSELWRHDVPKGTIDHHFLRANRYLAGETILAAHALQTKPHMLAVLDKRQTAGLAGTRHISGEFAALGQAVSVIAAPFERDRPSGGPATPDPFAPVVFAFARAQSENDALAAMLARLGFGARMMKDRRLAGEKPCSDWNEALVAASRLAKQARDRELPVRIICDYGPILQRDGSTDNDALLRLEAAFDLAAAAVGDVFATSAFVMAELAAGGNPTRFASVNISVEQGRDGAVLRGARQVYKVRWAET